MLKHGLITAAIIIIIDQLSKWLLLNLVLPHDSPIALTPFFNLVMVWNTGISFGLFKHIAYAAAFFTLIALIIVSILLYWLKSATHPFTAIAIGLVIGGAIGNVIDRLTYGAVADFFDFHIAGYHWPAFNIADSSVFIGAIVLCVDSVWQQDQKHAKTKKKKTS